jgi:flagellar protein FliO/FliZ
MRFALLTNNSHVLENLFKTFGLLLVFIVIIIACYYVTKLVGTNQLAKSKNSNFKILDTYKLGQNQLLAIVEVGTRYFCIGITKEQISLISELDTDSFTVPDIKGMPSFAGVFSQAVKAGSKKKNDGGGKSSEGPEENTPDKEDTDREI